MKHSYIYKFYKTGKTKFLNQKIDIAGIIYIHCIELHRTYYRIFKNISCSQKLDKDNNAAINILREGASSLSLDIVRLEDTSEYCWKLESNVL